MIRLHTGSTRTDTLFPYRTHFLTAQKSHRVRDIRRLALEADRGRVGDVGGVRVGGGGALAADQADAHRVHRDAVLAEFARQAPRHRVEAALPGMHRSEEHTSELQSLMRISYAVSCLKKNTTE